MKFFLDENMPVVAVPPLRALFEGRHEFETAHSLDVTGVDDVDLYPRVHQAGVLAIISKDDRQLKVEVERRGLFENQLSFVHLRTTAIAGRKGLALTVASLTAGIPYIEERWMPEPYVFRLKGLQSAFTERIHRAHSQSASPPISRSGATTGVTSRTREHGLLGSAVRKRRPFSTICFRPDGLSSPATDLEIGAAVNPGRGRPFVLRSRMS